MKYLIAVLTFVTFGAVADQRMETRDGFCHAVTPEGFQTANDDNEVFLSNCVNSIRQDADGNGDGSYVMKVKYPDGAAPFLASYTTSGAETGINCVMVDSNGTNYVTQDWDSTYKVKIKRYPVRQHGNESKPWTYKKVAEIEYRLACRNGAQQ